MAIQRELWEETIVGNVFRKNDFWMDAFNADQYVLQGRVVHIPQAGGLIGVSKNRNSLPAAVVRRTDTDATYSLDEYTTDPVHIPYADQVELSYDKRLSVTSEMVSALRQLVADNALYSWSPDVANYSFTKVNATGNDLAAYTTSAAGTRRGTKVADFLTMASLFDNEDIPEEDRYSILDANQYYSLLADLSATQFRDFSQVIDPRTGKVDELYGFKIRKRSKVLVADSNGIVKAPDAVAAADDCPVSLFWQKNSVERALGEVKFFERLDDPTYYGDIYSTLLRFGGRVRRADQKGVGVLFNGIGGQGA